MPASSRKQQRLMVAALHGADFPKAKKLRQSMTTEQLRDFAETPTGESYAYNFRSRNNLRKGQRRG